MNEINLRGVDLNLLTVFEALMAERHVGRAAERLLLTQSAASHALARMRDLFADPLFVRHPKGVEPTPRALALAPAVADILGRVRGVLDSGRAFDPAGANRVTIGATDGAFPLLLLPLIERMRALAPNTELRIRPMDPTGVVPALDRMEIDAAIMPMLQAPARVRRTPLRRIRYKAIARRGHPAFIDGMPDIAVFAALPHVTVSAKADTLALVDELLASSGIQRRIMLVVPHFLSVPLIVRSSDLVALLDEGVAGLFAADDRLSVFEPPFAIREATVDLLVAAGRAAEPALSWLHDQIVAAAGRMIRDNDLGQ